MKTLPKDANQGMAWVFYGVFMPSHDAINAGSGIASMSKGRYGLVKWWLRVSPLGSLGWGLPIEPPSFGSPMISSKEGLFSHASCPTKSVTCLPDGLIWCYLRVCCSVPKTANSHQFSRWVNDFMPWTCTHFRCNLRLLTRTPPAVSNEECHATLLSN